MTRRILYMDDEESCAQLAMRKLQPIGFEMDWVPNGEEGLARLKTGSYDVVAVDYHMPRMDGLEVVRALAANGSHPPIIMITGTGDEHVAVEAIKLGVNDYIIKDLEGQYLSLLPAVLEQVLKERDLSQEKERAIEALQRSEDALRKMNEQLEHRVADRTRELKALNHALQEKVLELETFHDVAVGREHKMIALEKRIEALEAELSALRASRRPTSV